MLLQSLLLIVTLAILGSALLASTLVSAKTAFHATILRQSRSAMTDATAEFISWAQENVRENGIDQLPVWAAAPHTTGRQPTCVRAIASSIGSAPANACNTYRMISWNTTGYLSDAENNTANAGDEVVSEAKKLAVAQNERRISATINISITNVTGITVYSRQSRQVTARVFHAYPYVAITGERDVSSQTGSISSSEGDTAGYASQEETAHVVYRSSSATRPASFTNTTVLTTINCENTNGNTSSNPDSDDNNVIFSQLRSVGNLSWVYEVPCNSAQPIDPSTAPIGYQPPKNNIYGTTATYDSTWRKDNQNNSSFAR